MGPSPAGTTLTPATEADRKFLFAVYAAGRAGEMAMVPWTVEQKQAFLRSQFDLQDRAYRGNYPGAQFLVIRQDGQPIGRLYLYETADEIRVMDIALLPEWRGAGIGGALMRDILARAGNSRRFVSLHVEHHNPALRLYHRLGFRAISDDAIFIRMEWRSIVR